MKLRIPDAWEGRLHSVAVRAWLQEFFQRPRPLPPDPGAGEARVSLSVPPRAIKVLEGLTGDSASGALRRLIAAHLPALPSSPRMVVFARPGRALALPSAWAEPEPASRIYGAPAPRWGSDAAEVISAWGDLRWKVPAWVILVGLGLALWLLLREPAQPVLKAVPAPELPRFREWIPFGVGGE